MLKITIPGQEDLMIKYVAFDFNGTLATDGKMHPFLKPQLEQLKQIVDIFVLTADTYGSVQVQCNDLGIDAYILTSACGTAEKKAFVEKLGAKSTVCVGNGVNDSGMFEACALSIIIMGEEGCAVKTLNKADIVVKNSEDALHLLLHPKRITATLRV
jgi:soluble P-type ATPase